jgi:TrmH family RNA methyltransferase
MKAFTKREIHDYQSLRHKKGRDSLQAFLVEGVHLVEEALSCGYPLHEILYLPSLMEKKGELIKKALTRNISCREIDERTIQKISTAETPQPVIASAPLPRMNRHVKDSAIYLYQASDPGNLGAIMRTALWYGVYHLLLSPESCDPFNPKVVRASQGAIFQISLNLEVDDKGLQELAKTHQILASDPRCVDFPAIQGTYLAVFGSESRGLTGWRSEAPYQKFGFAKKGAGESLNLAVAVGVFLDRMTGHENDILLC